jgi:hypothetical protein
MAMQADTTDKKSRMGVCACVICVQGGSVGALLLGLIYAFQEKLVSLDSVSVGSLLRP